MPDTEQLSSMFSDSGSTRPTAATVSRDVLSGGADGGVLGLWTGFEARAHVIANVRLKMAMIGTVYLFIRSSQPASGVRYFGQPWARTAPCRWLSCVPPRQLSRLPCE